ncbi:MAG TPA: hypothetical protein VGK73_25550 [Polyangiaceae bacterium]
MSDNEITLVQPERGPLPVPMTEEWDHEVAETMRAVPSEPGGYFDFVQQYATATQPKPFMLTRPSPPPPELRVDKQSNVPPPPPLPEVVKVGPKQPSSPPPPPEPRPRAQRTTDIPPPPPPFHHAPSFTPHLLVPPVAPQQATMRPPVAPQHAMMRAPVAAYEAPVQNMPSSIPPPVAVERRRITDRRQAGNKGRAWSMFTVGPLSALVAALVSSLVWSFHASELKSAAAVAAEEMTAATETASVVAPCTTTRSPSSTDQGQGTPATTSESTSSPMALATAMKAPAGVTPQVSIDQLPTVESGRSKTIFAAAPVTASEAAPRSRASRARAATPRPVDLTSASRQTASESEEAPAAAPPPAPSLPQGPDRAAITKAMGRASSAASSCGSGPQDGRVSLTIAPSGVVSSVSLVKGFGDADVNACVLRAFGRAKIPAYEGDPVQVKKGVRW